jgi:hypothetical protein
MSRNRAVQALLHITLLTMAAGIFMPRWKY